MPRHQIFLATSPGVVQVVRDKPISKEALESGPELQMNMVAPGLHPSTRVVRRNGMWVLIITWNKDPT